jgi:hypothetical protein
MLAEVADLIRGKDLKFSLTRSFWRNCFSLKEAWFASIIQIKFL